LWTGGLDCERFRFVDDLDFLLTSTWDRLYLRLVWDEFFLM